MFLALCGYLLQMDARGQNYVLGAALYEMAQAWLVFYSAYRMLSPGRVAELHFGWSRPQVAFLRDEIRRLGLIVMALRSEEHTSELQSLMRISYAVFCLKKKKKKDTELRSRY